MLRGADSHPEVPRGAPQDAEGGATPPAHGTDDDRLLDLLERWEERYRSDEATPDSLGIDDPALMVALRERIARQKRLYAFLKLSPPEEEGSGEGSPGHVREAPDAVGPGASPPRAEMPMIGRYRALRVLGQGGFGRVYLAYDADLQRNVAVKVPVVGAASRFLDLEAYLREARIVARLSHPSIVPVYDVGHLDDGRCFVVSKFMEGGDLKGRLEHGRPSFAESADLVAILCDALQYTHTQDLFHRDIKPGNILLDADGVPSLADFGLALRDEEIGQGAGYLGTAAYMSPEQARGEGHRVDGRSDIFSIGVVLYELLTGRRPFRGRTHLEIMEQVVHAEPRPPRQIDGAIPPELERICLKAMAKRASERYTAARDLAEDLRHFLAGISWAATTADRPPLVAPGREPSPTASTTASDSGTRPVEIVPRGLASFDEHDADFFLELLPGPRDRDGLPDVLRFWKTRIESTDPDRAFRVGLIYGPSGCGKSSMVKAGLLPRLAPHVCSIYVEAAGSETEARLHRGLRRLFPALPAERGLPEALKVLRCGHGLPAGRKVLLVLDQFEQWLFARRDERGDELAAALRQCDGERVQALCLVRDDFWMAATRFMKDVDTELVPERNVAAVDLFESRHARKVLAAYGRAYEALPPRSADLSRDQQAFLDQAVDGLAQGGRVVPVRLALFAEMVKGRPWTPATLREVGGMDGVGVKFLEDCFSSPRSQPNHRYHQKAAQAVLKALLPESNADIKGRMRSIEELREVSGYAGRPSDFAGLIRMLDGELRLITPVDPEGSVDEEAAPPAPEGRFFQLTHDYLVHALREWLTRKQRETRRGRAELLLTERTTAWGARMEDRHLPSLREWASIRLLTRSGDWSEAQRRMMRRAGVLLGVRTSGVVIVAVGLLAAGLALWRRADEIYQKTQARALVRGLLAADTASVRPLIREIQDYRRWAVPDLERSVRGSPDESRQKLHASLALLPVDAGQIDYLYGRLLTADAAEMAVIRDTLEPHRARLIDRMWADLRAARPGDPRILPLGGTLARYAAQDLAKSEMGDRIADSMVRAPLGELKDWREAFADVRSALILPLSRIVRDRERGDQRAFAATVLCSYAADQPMVLLDLLLDADPGLFPIFLRAVQHRTEECLPELRATVESASTGPPFKPRAADEPGNPGNRATDRDPERAGDRSASRGAHAAVALIRLGHPDGVGRLLEYRRDPRSRSALIDAFSSLGVDPAFLAAELSRLDGQPPMANPSAGMDDDLFDKVTSRRRALILALAGYPREAIETPQQEALVSRLVAIHRDDPDAGVHSAAELILTRWGESDRLGRRPTPVPRPGERRWYVNSALQTMVIVEGPVRFRMGSPPSDADRQGMEYHHWRVIPGRFAVSAKEVSIEEFQAFSREVRGTSHEYDRRYSSDPRGPVINVSWFDAIEFCNWLSRREHLPACYRASNGRDFAAGVEVDLQAVERGGYRLLTEAEWEYACRAGSETSRYFGGMPELLGRYEWFIGNSDGRAHPSGLRLPNDLGLFDMLGNVQEWCHDAHVDFRPGPDDVVADRPSVRIVPGDSCHVRGQTFLNPTQNLRSAVRTWRIPERGRPDVGFRVGRRIPAPS